MSRQPFASERGSQLLEFAVASGLFISMFFAILNGGIVVWKYNMLSNLAQEGARWAAVRGNTSAASIQATGTRASLQSYVQARSPIGSVTVATSPDVDSNTLSPGTSYEVTVTQPVSAWIGFTVWSFTTTATARMQIDR